MFESGVNILIFYEIFQAVRIIKDAVGKGDAGEKWFAPFLTSINVTENYYQGKKSLDGNSCRKLLRHAEELEDMAMDAPEHARDQIIAPSKALVAFDKVVHECFGNELVGDLASLSITIKEFSRLWRAIPRATVPPKVHCVESHIITFLERFVSSNIKEYLFKL